MPIFSFPDDNLSKSQGLLTKLAICIDIIKIWLRIVICPSVIFFPDIFATITLFHKQIIAIAGYYACCAFINVIVFIRATDHVITMLCHVTKNCEWREHFQFQGYQLIEA